MKIYNTMSRQVENFLPIEKGKIRLYTCGPTVYNYAHIGNLRTFMFEDFLKRSLEYLGFEVRHVMNITDVGHLVSDADQGEDKMEKGARREKKSVWEIAQFYTEEVQKDFAALNIKPPTVWCKATDHIQEQMDLINRLEEANFTYKIEDGIYMDTDKLANYGKLARLDKSNLKAGARVETSSGKRNPVTDFALWKFSPTDQKRQMEWDSPWGRGFPGWHIECSAMAIKYLGDNIDIHCGGVDHIPIHHTNEIAQVEAVTGKTWVNYWMHGEFLVVGKDIKMSKSQDNFLSLAELKRQGFAPTAYRLFVLGAHYRNPQTFSMEGLNCAQLSWRRLQNIMRCLKENFETAPPAREEIIGKWKEKFSQAVGNDLNMPQALSILWTALQDNELGFREKWELALDFDQVLGLQLEEAAHSCAQDEVEMNEEIEKMIQAREKARKEKNWAVADCVRDELKSMGIVLEDTPEGVRWRKG